jgi:hypothetical protein
MKEQKIVNQILAELTLLQGEGVDDLMISEQGLRAIMSFTMMVAPSKLNGIHLINHVFHDIITDTTIKQIEGKDNASS